MDKLNVTHAMVHSAIVKLAEQYPQVRSHLKIHGVPRGGIPVAYLLANAAFDTVVDKPEEADIIVDDIIDTGATRQRYLRRCPKTPFVALADYIPHPRGVWLVFPWEVNNGIDTSAHDIPIRLLEYIGEDPKRGGLKETPARFLKAWKDWTAGYDQKVTDVLKVFEDGAESYNEMVIVRNLPFYSMCEHHLAPFFGTATIAYLPDKKVVGLSKLQRVLNIFAKRLQVQERLTTQIADALTEHVKPQGTGVLLRARHLCMESRGVATQGHETVTSALRGNFLLPQVRSEFLSLADNS